MAEPFDPAKAREDEGHYEFGLRLEIDNQREANPVWAKWADGLLNAKATLESALAEIDRLKEALLAETIVKMVVDSIKRELAEANSALARKDEEIERLTEEADGVCRLLDSMCRTHAPSAAWPSLHSLTCGVCSRAALFRKDEEIERLSRMVKTLTKACERYDEEAGNA